MRTKHYFQECAESDATYWRVTCLDCNTAEVKASRRNVELYKRGHMKSRHQGQWPAFALQPLQAGRRDRTVLTPMTLTDREMQILRLIEAGVVLKPRGGASFGAVFDFSRTAANVLKPTLVAMQRRDLLTYDKDLNRYELTPTAREHVAVRTRVRDFAEETK